MELRIGWLLSVLFQGPRPRSHCDAWHACPLQPPDHPFHKTLAFSLCDCSLAVSEDGKLFAWGEGRAGQLGLGMGTRLVATPTQVTQVTTAMDDTGAEVIAPCPPMARATCGLAHSGALARHGGQLFMFGWGDDGRLGLGDDVIETPVATPVRNSVLSVCASVCARGVGWGWRMRCSGWGPWG